MAKPRMITHIEYAKVEDVKDYFSENKITWIDDFLSAIEFGIQKRKTSVSIFSLKKNGVPMIFNFALIKELWIPTLEKISKICLEKEMYEEITKINLLLIKLKPKSNEKVLSSKNPN